ncbi:hypothetical protein [Mycolicibacterium baixiangningiae]|uniref:hypothetical protein n=1 Tax=Mycolicibacterium baixiangningiae TaxID=2761578 RepID=UPI0018686511|nr:hypothetical protein [Mycolicibacterium baixiangningiae]
MPPAGVTMIGDLFHAGKRGQITPVTTASSPERLHLSGGHGEVFVTAYATTKPRRSATY